MDQYLTKTDVALIKAISIILMLIHHFWGFPEWLLNNEMKKNCFIAGIDIEYSFAIFGKICVALFAFITGYIISKNRNKYLQCDYRFHKILTFLTKYWINYFLILFAGFCINEPMPSAKTALGCALGLWGGVEKTYVNCCFSWYVLFYLEIMLLVPVLVKIITLDFVKTVGGCALGCLFLKVIFRNIAPINEFVSYLPVVVCGYCVSQYKLFDRVSEKCDAMRHKYHISSLGERYVFLISIIIVIITKILLFPVVRHTLDFILAPIFIFLIIRIKNSVSFRVLHLESLANRIIAILASESTNIWFLHAIFFTPNRGFQFIAFWPQNGILVIIWILALLIPISIVITKIHKGVWKIGKIFSKRT